MAKQTPESIKADLITRLNALPNDKLAAIDRAIRQVELQGESAVPVVLPTDEIAASYDQLDDAGKRRVSQMLSRHSEQAAKKAERRATSARGRVPKR